MCEIDINNLSKSLPNTARGIELLHKNRKAILESTKGDFNVFTAILKAHDETRLHSRFITYLLNPKANHECGRKFLDLFIATLCDDQLIPKSSNNKFTFNRNSLKSIKQNNIKCREVRTEQPADNRRIDIYLKFDGYVIAIENKIKAYEQPQQIADYADFIDSEETNNFLFYLTLFGKESHTDESIKTNEKVEYFCISYYEHIMNWLERCLSATYRYPNINQVIQQYQNVVKQLTGQTMENEDMEEIKKLIKCNPAVLEFSNEIDAASKQLIRDWLDDFWESLQTELQSREISTEKLEKLKPFEYLFIEKYINIKVDGSNIQIPFVVEITFSTGYLRIGLVSHKKIDNTESSLTPTDNEEKQKIFEEIQSMPNFRNLASDNCSMWWVLGEHILQENFYTNSFIANHLDYKAKNNFIKECVDKISEYIDKVQRKLS